MKKLNISLFAALFFFFFANQAQASGTNCAIVYGGGYTGSESCAKLRIDKKVQNPSTKEFVDGLYGNDPKYAVNQQVPFQITVQNVSDTKISTIEVVDTLPQYVQFVSGPGSYNKDANTLSFVIASLEPGQSQTVTIQTKVTDQAINTNNGYVCVTNNVRTVVKDMANSDDSAQFCIAQTLKVYPPVLGIKQTPPTGPVDAALPILISMAGAGMYLTRKTHLRVIKKRGGVTK